MAEVIAAARELGFPLSTDLIQVNLDRTSSMGPYKASTVLDFERGFPLEVEQIFFEPLRQASAAGVATPALAALCKILAKLRPEG
jgi:2-dehydropantoate 2-reductase